MNAENGCGGAWRNGLREVAGGKTKTFVDLDVYKSSYESMLLIFKKILPELPKQERFDLYDQLSRSSKAIPRLIAEGHAKRHQNKGFQKYIDDAHAESNETIVSLCQFKDLYAFADLLELCDVLIDTYDKISRQLCNLAIAWENFHKRIPGRFRYPHDDSQDATA